MFFQYFKWNSGGLGVSRRTAPTIRCYLQSFSRFGGTWGQKVHFSTFFCKLTFQCSRNGPQNPPFCPGSLHDTFIIYGPHGVPMGSHGVPMGFHGLPWKIQECRKSWILMKTTIRFDRIDEARGPVRCAIFFRSILSRQNALNRHMEQNMFFCQKIKFFSFSPYRAPIEPL